jgi:hypothetical protein
MDGTADTRQRPIGTDLPTFQGDHRNLFDLLRRRSAADLAGVLDGFFDAVAMQVHQAWLENADSRARQFDREMAATLRQRAPQFAADYRQRIEDAFDGWLHHALDAGTQPGSLSLMSESQLQMQLLAQTVGGELAHQLDPALGQLEGRMASLRGALGGAGDARSPLHPLKLAHLFGAGFGSDEIGEALREMLFREYARRLAPRLAALYAQVDRELADAGHVARAAPVAQERPMASVPPPSQGWVPDGGTVEYAGAASSMQNTAPAPRPNAGPPPPAPPADGVPLRYRDIVREQLRQWRDRGTTPAANDDAAPAALDVRALHTVASLLQGDDPSLFARELGRADGRALAHSIRQAMSSGARQLGLAPTGLRFAPDEEDAIDLVAMLFDCLVRTRDMSVAAAADSEPDGIAQLYGRLVMPYVKIALLDDSLFNRRSHPARQLLDALTEVCEDDGHERSGLDFADGVVDRVVGGFREDLTIFELAVEELRQFQQQQRRRAELAERRAAEAVHGRERLRLARAHSTRELAAWLGRQPLTQATADFLCGPWRHAADQAWLRDGAESPRRRELAALGEALLALDAESTVACGDTVARAWLARQARVTACCSVAGLDGAAAGETVARLIFAFAHPDSPRSLHAPDAEAFDSPDEDVPGLRLVGGIETVPHDPVLSERMRRLRVGQALRLIEEDGSESSARVAWISPLTARLLIVNRRGQRKLVLSPEQLAVLVASGRVALRAPTAPFDQAMQRLWRQLNDARAEPLAAAG